MNTFQLKCFLMVAETLNFAKASRNLNTTQPTITHQIKSLEDELGTKLFNRSTRVVELTADGIAFLDDARSMVLIEEQAKLRFSIPNEKNIEAITIGCTSNLQVNLLENALCKLDREIKNFHPIFVINTRSHLMHLMDTDQLDILFDLVDDNASDKKYHFVELRKSNIVGYCKNEKPFNSIKKISPNEPFSYPVIFTTPTNNISNLSHFQRLIMQNLDITNVHFAQSPEVAQSLARAGVGVAILPSLYIHNISPEIRLIPVENAPSHTFGMYHKSPAEKPLLKAFISAVKTEFLG